MKISERQGILYETIGYLEEESLATVKVWTIAGLSLFFVIVFTVIEAGLFILYNNKYHPFKNILLDMDSKENKENNNNDDRNIPMNDLSWENIILSDIFIKAHTVILKCFRIKE